MRSRKHKCWLTGEKLLLQEKSVRSFENEIWQWEYQTSSLVIYSSWVRKKGVCHGWKQSPECRTQRLLLPDSAFWSRQTYLLSIFVTLRLLCTTHELSCFKLHVGKSLEMRPSHGRKRLASPRKFSVHFALGVRWLIESHHVHKQQHPCSRSSMTGTPHSPEHLLISMQTYLVCFYISKSSNFLWT